MSKKEKNSGGHKKGRKVIGRIVSIRGHCSYGLKVGDEFELGHMSTSGICPDLFYNIYPSVMTYQFGGKFPETGTLAGERMEFTCPDVINAARIQLRPEGVDPTRHPVYLEDEKNEEKKWRKRLGKQ
jgi:uncharacterized repeat protein (TIGR04076 family)